MKKYRGPVSEVSSSSWQGGGVGGLAVDTIRIGNQTLRNVNVNDTLVAHLRPDAAREVCLYVLRMPNGALPTSFTPNLLGMKYMDTSEKHLVPFSFILGSSLRYAVIPALVWSIGGGVAGMVIGTLIGFAGVTNEALVVLPAGLGFFGGLGMAWWCALRLPLEYGRARAD